MKTIIIDNSDPKKSRKLKKIIKAYHPNIDLIRTNESKDMNNVLKSKLHKDLRLVISAGGDGTINHIINSIMKIDKDLIKNINFAVLPCGTTNDLANQLSMSKDIKTALKQILKGKIKKIDLIKVNNNYFITGGGMGLPAQIVEDSNKFSLTFFGKLIKRNMKDFIYFISTLKKFLFGYKKLRLIESEELKNIELLAIYVLNQSFIGKRFNIAPEARNNDGYTDIKFVKIPPTFLSNFTTLSRGTKG